MFSCLHKFQINLLVIIFSGPKYFPAGEPPFIMCIQYVRGCSVHWKDIMSHVKEYHEFTGRVGGIQYSTLGDIMIHVGELIAAEGSLYSWS